MTASLRTTGIRWLATAFVVLGSFAGMLAFGADRASSSAYYYPGSAGSAGDAFARQQGAGGTYRPAESSTAPWQAPAGAGASSTWRPDPSWGQGGASAWSGQGQGFQTQGQQASGYQAQDYQPQGYGGYQGPQAVTGQGERPLGNYRFRQRAEDKAIKPDDSPRYRPDPELSRRSQQFWGVPGQDPSAYSAGPGIVFRPLRPEQEQSGGSATGQYRGETAPPPLGGYPGPPGYGYGYPY